MTFNKLQNSGSATVNLIVKDLGFLPFGDNLYLVRGSQMVQDSPIQYVTDTGYATAYAGIIDPNAIAAPVIVTQPVNWVGWDGEQACFNVVAEGVGLTYQWFYRAPNKTKWTATAGTDAAYSIPMSAARNGRQLKCTVTDILGQSVDTDVVTMTYQVGPHIITQPTDGYARDGEQVNINVVAEGDGLTYQWYYRLPGTEKWNKTSTQTPNYSITMTQTRNGRELYCLITDADGNTAATDVVTMTYPPYEAPSITTQPTDWTGANGAQVNFSVVAEGEGLTYLWYYRNPGSAKWTKTSTTTPNYSITMTQARNGRELYCLITDAIGTTIESDIVTMSIAVPAGPVIVTQPTDWIGANGAQVSFNVVAKGTGLTYQWFYRAQGKTKWTATSDTDDTYNITMTSSRSGRQLKCVITDSNGRSVETNVVTMSIG